jgi:hypothetical protein
MYKLILNHLGQKNEVVQKIEEGVIHNIPMHPDNTDYQQYLKWVAEGNTATPADNTGAAA